LNTSSILGLAGQAAEGNPKALGKLRDELLGASPTNDLDGLSERWAAVILVARMLLNLVWVNICTDSKFSVQESDVVPLARGLGRFVQTAANEDEDMSGEAVDALTSFVTAFRSTVIRLNEQGEEPWVGELPAPAS
jgi:hypothetical protein